MTHSAESLGSAPKGFTYRNPMSPAGSRRTTLDVSAKMIEFVATELVSWAREEYSISKDPAHVVIGGNGAGGAVASIVATRHPETFGKVLLESADLSDGAAAAELAKAAQRPQRFAISVGNLESSEVKISSRQLRDVLIARGDAPTYATFSGNHHTTSWLGTLASQLPALLAP